MTVLHVTHPRRLLLAVLLLASAVLRSHTSAAQKPPPAAPVQPLPYSHKTHVALGLECRTCHVNPAPGKLMTFPPTGLCMECHKALRAERPAIRKLAAFAASGRPIPWVRIYQTPDYVFWKHATHLKAGVTCAECHGPVAERDVITQETNVVTMAGCLACHDQRQVFTDCRDCHEPRQSDPRGFATRTPRHALSLGASPPRSDRMARSLPLVRGRPLAAWRFVRYLPVSRLSRTLRED